ncbi:MAG TPA: energy transducer TonB, partial [Pyrinomonadaceae bacterium]|nr:energy transducer TonB [Pyrinomonadaceae bacterium]
AGGGGASAGGGSGAGAGKGVGLDAQIIDAPNPSYPPIAKAAKAEGTVSVKVTVDEEGNVVAAAAVSGHPLLRSAAVDAARAAKFKPTVVDGKPVKVSAVISYDFIMQ